MRIILQKLAGFLVVLIAFVPAAQAATSPSSGRFQQMRFTDIPAETAEDVIFVPGEVATLQSAITQVVDGGVIELAQGTYSAPSGGFRITNTGRRFTISLFESMRKINEP